MPEDTTKITKYDISALQFGLATEGEIIDMSIGEINNPKQEGHGSIYDPRMGCSMDTNEKCETCGLRVNCPGHFGHITLATPVIHTSHINMTIAFLRAFCNNPSCNKLLLTSEMIDIGPYKRLKGLDRFSAIVNDVKDIGMCAHCSSPQASISHNKKQNIITMELRDKKGRRSKEDKVIVNLEPSDIYKIFDRISDDDMRICGFDPENVHARDLIINVLPVLPPCGRPHVRTDNNNICDDDLTIQYMEIIKISNELKNPELSTQRRQKLEQSLSFQIDAMIDNHDGKARHPTNNRPKKCIHTRIAGKGGITRSNLMGKRVNYSARTVIGPGPDLKIDQVGVPNHICRILTVPEKATAYNIKALEKFVNNDEANYIVKPNGRRINLKYACHYRGTELLLGDIVIRDPTIIVETKPSGKAVGEDGKRFKGNEPGVIKVGGIPITLQKGDRVIRDKKLIEVRYPTKRYVNVSVGDIVERHLMKGDVVLHNRQPSLHKYSMFAKKVVPVPGKTIRFNLAVTKAYNADYDGKICYQQEA